MKHERKVPAPRNPYAMAAKLKQAGPHRKSEKATRRALKVAGRKMEGESGTDKEYSAKSSRALTKTTAISSVL